MEIPPHISVSQFVQKAKGRSSRKAQMEFPELKKRCWGQRFWTRGYFCTISGNITDEVILNYLKNHSKPH
jgi:putative transposase